ncbi:peroxiredoxin family protein [Polaromonas jejuensis]|uniref:Peroxiredoxin family protein n=1 Tax=Polaromonas jejuensis TaxID=457502 RepID=A0ABW0Q5N2_9BURK|nr:TlpA disulfide reductase family protein [Polaromonas jejuensis]
MNRLLFIVIFVFSLPAISADLVVGSPAPDVEATLLDSPTRVRLSANQGKVTIINFWATWCAPCREEMPAIQAYYDKHKAEGLEILAISMDDASNLAKVRKVAQSFTFPIAIKSEANFKGLGRVWRMPSTFVVDKDGILRKNGHVGDPEVTLPLLESLVTPLLNSR